MDSGKHKIVSSWPNGPLDSCSGRKRQKYQKRKFLLHGTLKIVYQIYHSKQEKQKRKSKFFIATILYFPGWNNLGYGLNLFITSESIKRDLKRRLIYKYRCDERLKLKLRNLHVSQTHARQTDDTTFF